MFFIGFFVSKDVQLPNCHRKSRSFDHGRLRNETSYGFFLKVFSSFKKKTKIILKENVEKKESAC